MSNPKNPDESASRPADGGVPDRADPKVASDQTRSESSAHDAKPSNKLTPEQQMELYEKDLKENDWGHQPC